MLEVLYLGDGLLLQYLQKDNELGISKRINKKAFRIRYVILV